MAYGKGKKRKTKPGSKRYTPADFPAEGFLAQILNAFRQTKRARTNGPSRAQLRRAMPDLVNRMLNLFEPGDVPEPTPMSYPLHSDKPNQRQRRKRARWVGARVAS